eukprot:TRINITY_DN63507_c0_g1_i1.p1 TRINITY_DN63507_c0_g1~~TRINITY_DN63507_c0_g1_i1.p1  ORF type:complete len:343 (-),score=53.99 TRINITY_DN63507_c0_g1_i1:200-1228(-)
MGEPWIEGYIINEKIGSGATGVVYRASSLRASSTDEYAVKIYGGARALQQFERETEFLKLVRGHPNVVNLVGSQQGPCLAIMMPFYRGQSLEAYVRQCSGLSEFAAACIMRKVLAAAQHVHQCGVLHRDIKPENMIVCEDGGVVLVDFDIACHQSDGMHPHRLRGGTPGYAPPEAIMREPIGTPSDLFSIGCVLYFMFKRKSPFYTRPYVEKAVLRKTVTCEFEFDMRFDVVSPECKAMISSLITRRPATRLSVVQAFGHEWFAVMSASIQHRATGITMVTGSRAGRYQGRASYGGRSSQTSLQDESASTSSMEPRASVEDADSTESLSRQSTRELPSTASV